METIRILQNIYEELYVARKPLANFEDIKSEVEKSYYT